MPTVSPINMDRLEVQSAGAPRPSYRRAASPPAMRNGSSIRNRFFVKSGCEHAARSREKSRATQKKVGGQPARAGRAPPAETGEDLPQFYKAEQVRITARHGRPKGVRVLACAEVAV